MGAKAVPRLMQALWLRPFPAEQEPAPAISDGATNPKARS